MLVKKVKIGNVAIGGGKALVFIAGPCVIESEKVTLKIAEKLKKLSDNLNLSVVFKSSYDKANRTSIKSYRGPGLKKGLMILEKVRKITGLPVISDVHSAGEISYAGEVLDAVQIPAFLCRQTDLILAAAKTGKPVNIKKGQFLAPWDVKNIIHKIQSAGSDKILITERGVSFGYNNLVVDMRAIPVMRGFGFPVVYDATHSVQLPGGLGASSGGQREFIAPLARAAVSTGCDAVFMEVHECPDKALCDGPNMLNVNELAPLIRELLEINCIVRK